MVNVSSDTSPSRRPLLAADLSVRRDDFLLEVSLRLAEGEVLVLLGPNGAGKSTVLRALAGLVPAAGMIELAGRRIDQVRAERRGIGLVFADHLLFPHLTVTDNIAFGPRATGQGRRAAAAVARRWMERLDLTDFADRRPGQLSGGQAQRVALARAAAGAPDLLLLDEPLAALDGRTRLRVRSDLRRDLRTLARGAVVVTHDPVDAMVLADRVLVIEGGAIVQEGAPTDLAARPRTDYLAQLFGLNLIPGVADGSVIRAVGGAGSITVAGTHHGGVFTTFAPSSVSILVEQPRGSPRNVWSGDIVRVEPIGDRVRVDVAVPELGETVRADVTPAAAAELEVHHGPVWLAVKAMEVAVHPR
ncbi:MAG: ABC transporter ATP-binding protein [Propionibacteriales bacterium]|nr:ABC transporter ATP-binding protein [Propionibacteriales bacterium]